MKIGKYSWHAKLNEYVWGDWYVRHATNLCPYFWGTVLACLVVPLVAMFKGIEHVSLPTVDFPEVEVYEKVTISGNVQVIPPDHPVFDTEFFIFKDLQ